MKKFINSIMLLTVLTLVSACQPNEEVGDDFDPSPYLSQAFQVIINQENSSIDPITATWIYADDGAEEELSVVYVFSSFHKVATSATDYAVVTAYINKTTETLAYIVGDQINNDELNASNSSAQAFAEFYVSILSQMQAVENRLVLEGVFTQTQISEAMALLTSSSLLRNVNFSYPNNLD